MGQQKQLYRLTPSELFQQLATSEHGLSDDEASSRLHHHGPNAITSKEGTSALSLFLSQFQNSLILILLAAAGLVFFVWYFGERDQSDLIEGILILSIVLLITVLGFFQEWKAEKAIDALKLLLAYKAKVLRAGKVKEIDVRNLVPGDVVILEEGSKVPADMRLIAAANLAINEASLTGESAPVNKSEHPIEGEQSLQLADQRNMAFSGTTVTQGRGVGVVISTGNQTEIGKIATFVAEAGEEPTPIQKRLNHVGRLLGWAVVGIAAVIFLLIVFFAEDPADSLLTRVVHSFVAAVALAVAAIPEGLPAVVTISLALGTQRMLKRNALVRRLSSVETLGSTDTICADKTGTLTKGEMTVTEIVVDHSLYTVTGSGYETKGEFLLDGKRADPKRLHDILMVGVHANNASLGENGSIIGDPTEAALLVAGAKAGVTDTFKRLREIPFSSARKMMSVAVSENGKEMVYTKGAPEVVLGRCTHIAIGGKTVPLTEQSRRGMLKETHRMSERALRTLGFARKEAQAGKEDEEGLTFLGLMGMIDPPRPEIAPLIRQCHDSGIRVIMITGDHAATAAAIAKEVNLSGRVLTGEELDALSALEFEEAVREVNVYARVNPGFKMRIVEALKKHGSIVAMTGDGVNDAPALKKADIGIAMGITGTDVSKEASDMILIDDNFGSIVSAIEEGRGIFENIRKFVNYLLSCNIGEVIVIFLGVVLLRDVLLTATMLLWINVVTDGLPAVALGMDPAQRTILTAKPSRFQGEIITKKLWVEMVLFGILIAIGILAIYWLNLSESQEEARATAFVAIVLYELIRLFHIRSAHATPFFSNPWLLAAVATSVMLQLTIVYVPFLADLFGVAHVDFVDWLYILGGGLLIWGAYRLLLPLLGRLLPAQFAETS